jgi:hypothetical protein
MPLTAPDGGRAAFNLHSLMGILRPAAASPLTAAQIAVVVLVMWNMRRRHSSHSCQPAAAEPSVKAVRSTPRSGRSEAESLYGRRSGGYTRVSAPGCRFQTLALCFQQVPRAPAAGYSRSNREQPILRSTTVFLAGSRRGNLQQLCSTRAGVTCHPSSRCRRQRFSLGWLAHALRGCQRADTHTRRCYFCLRA